MKKHIMLQNKQIHDEVAVSKTRERDIPVQFRVLAGASSQFIGKKEGHFNNCIKI